MTDQHRPEVDSSTEFYWAALAEGRLVASRCAACGTVDAHPRGFCPSCWNDQVEEVQLSGRATLYTFTVVHANPMPPFSDDVPYIAALVDLEEGPRLTTRLVDVEPADVHIGMKLMARCTTTADGDGIVLFTSADGS